MTLNILIAAVVILICVLLSRVSFKLGVPMLFAFIALGMLFGSDGLVRIEFSNYALAGDVCSIALIFIMFYGGFGTKWSEARPVALSAGILSTVGVVLTALFTGLFCHFVMGMELTESFLLGAVISSTDAASVFSILRSKRLNLRHNTASLLEVESGSNDPMSYMLTIIMLTIINGQDSGGGIAYAIFAQFVYGAAGGVLIALLAREVLKRVRFKTAGFDTVFTVAVALMAYALPSLIGGNGYLSAYMVGIILGNSNIRNKAGLVNFFDGVTGLMQMLIFFLLGLLANPSDMPQILLSSVAIALALTFVARPLAVFAILTPFRCSLAQRLLVSWAGLRGAASIVFAVLVMTSGGAGYGDLFHTVFCIVLFSIALQGSLLPLVAKRLNMIDEKGDVLKTFNDYFEEEPVQFVKLKIGSDNPWAGKRVRELSLPQGTLLVLLLRGEERIIPKGDTIVESGDELVLSAEAFDENDVGISLTELTLTKHHSWNGKTVAASQGHSEGLIILIKRGEQVLIPGGDTVLAENDTLVLCKPEI